MKVPAVISNWVLGYLRLLARLQLKKINPDIIGVTGSAGKTSLVAAIGAILDTQYTTKVTSCSNSESGIPLDILGLKLKDYSVNDWLRVMVLAKIAVWTNWRKYQKYVVEMGVDSPLLPKNMSYLLTIVKPKMGVFLNVAAAHTQQFGNVEAIAQEKGKLIGQLPQDGVAILNRDEPLVWQWKNKTRAKVMSFGKNEAADFRLMQVNSGPEGFRMEFRHRNKNYRLEFKHYLLSPAYGLTFLAAIATGAACQVPVGEAVAALEKEFKPAPGRMSLIEGIKNTTIIDSSYNASRQPMVDALELLKNFKGKRKLAVLGDMRELGDKAKEEHELVAQAAVKVADEVVTVGPLMQQYFVPQALALGFDKDKLYSFNSSRQAGELIKNKLLQESDVVLVKGSQNTIFLETIVEMLMQHPEQANELLCRRGKFWERMRTKTA